MFSLSFSPSPSPSSSLFSFAFGNFDSSLLFYSRPLVSNLNNFTRHLLVSLLSPSSFFTSNCTYLFDCKGNILLTVYALFFLSISIHQFNYISSTLERNVSLSLSPGNIVKEHLRHSLCPVSRLALYSNHGSTLLSFMTSIQPALMEEERFLVIFNHHR